MLHRLSASDFILAANLNQCNQVSLCDLVYSVYEAVIIIIIITIYKIYIALDDRLHINHFYNVNDNDACS